MNNVFAFPFFNPIIITNILIILSFYNWCNIVYCKPFSNKIKNSYIFEVKSKKSKAVLKAIFYPYKNAVHSLEVRTHKVFLDSSYINEVFDSYEFNFEPEKEQELFRNKLMDLSVLYAKNHKEDFGNLLCKINKILEKTNDVTLIAESYKYLWDKNVTDKSLFKNFWGKLFKLLDENSLNKFSDDFFIEIDSTKLLLYFEFLNSLSMNRPEYAQKIFDKLILLTPYLNDDNIGLSKDESKNRNSNSIYKELISTFYYLLKDKQTNKNIINPQYLRNYCLLLNNEYYIEPLSKILNGDVLYKLRTSEFKIDESNLINAYKKFGKLSDSNFYIYYKGMMHDKGQSITRLLVYLSKSVETLEYIERNILNNSEVDMYNKFIFYCLNRDKNGFDFKNYFEDNKNLYMAYISLRSMGKLDLIPENFMHYDFIAKSQINWYMSIDWSNINFKKIIKHEVVNNGLKNFYLVFYVEAGDNVISLYKQPIKTQFTIITSPYSYQKEDINHLEIPNRIICMKKGFLDKQEIQESIDSINQDGNTNCYKIPILENF